MASKSDSTHANHITNFEELIISIQGYGNAYNPTKESIKLPALESLAVKAREASDNYKMAEASQKNAIAARNGAFKPLGTFITKVKNALAATDTTQQVDESVKSLVRKIQGQRATAKLTEEEIKILKATGKEVSQISSSQMSYDNRVDNFDKLIKLLLTIELYAPNEEELKTSSLIKYHDNLKALNTTVVQSNTAADNARIVRNEIFYKENTGLCDISQNVKTYVKSVFGATNPQYRQISGLKFSNKK